MKALFGAVVVLLVGWTIAEAAPRKILVLPIDGSVEPATRARLNANVQKLASNIDGKVTIGDTTFDETAAALGCDAETQTCAESVRATLGVDELVFGRATTTGAQTTLVVRRVRSKTEWREGQATFSVDETPEKADTTVGTELSPLFDVTPPPPPVVETPPVAETPPPAANVDEPSAPGRTRGILLATGGGVAAILGVVLWADVSSTQDEIDAANPEDDDDFRALEDKEDKAQRNAIIGDVLVVAGVAVAAWGAWTIYKSRESAASVTVTPTATPTSAGVSIGGRW